MPIDAKHQELEGLRIDRSSRGNEGEPSPWAKRIIVIGVSIVALLGLSALAYRLFAANAPEVETARATVESGSDPTAGVVLTATGYIVAHHKIEANSKVTGPSGMDRSGERRQRQRRTSVGTPGGSGIPRSI